MSKRESDIVVYMEPSEKKEIEKYTEEERAASSLSSFSRRVLLRHVRKQKSDRAGQNNISVDNIVEKLTNEMPERHQQMDELFAAIDRIEELLMTDDEIDELAREIHTALPVCNDARELPDLSIEYRPEESIAEARDMSTPSAWAAWYSTDQSKTRRACSRMMDLYDDVDAVSPRETTSDITERRFYRVKTDE